MKKGLTARSRQSSLVIRLIFGIQIALYSISRLLFSEPSVWGLVITACTFLLCCLADYHLQSSQKGKGIDPAGCVEITEGILVKIHEFRFDLQADAPEINRREL